MKPLMSQREIVKYKELVKDKIYFEFGAGGSTFTASQSGVKKIYSVESDIDWIAKMKTNPEMDKWCNEGLVNLIHGDIGPTRSWGKPLNFDYKDKWTNYTDAFLNLDEKFDMVFIDGRFRVATILAAVKKVNQDCLIVAHDYNNRPRYHIVEKFVDVIERIDTMCIMRKKKDKDIDWNYLGKIFDAYKYDYNDNLTNIEEL